MLLFEVWLIQVFNVFQDDASAIKAQLDQQKGVVDNLVSNTRVSLLSLLINFLL